MPLPDNIKLQGGQVDVYIYGDIHPDWGFSATDLQEALEEAGSNTPVNVYISSTGGSVVEGLNIYNILRSHKGQVTTINTSMAASMASIIFLAGDVRQMYDNALLMIHNPAMAASGDKKDFEDTIELLKRVETNVIDIYSGRSGQTKDQVKLWLGERRDKFFNAQESLDLGFATLVIEALDLAAAVDLDQLIAKLTDSSNTKGSNMNPEFKKWLVELGYDKPEDIPANVLKNLEAKYNDEIATLVAKGTTVPPTLPSTPPVKDDLKTLEARRKADAAEEDRVGKIRAYGKTNVDMVLSQEKVKEQGLTVTDISSLCAHAIKDGWSIDKLELTGYRIGQPDVGPAVHTADVPQLDNNLEALQCALCRESGMPATKNVNGIDFGYQHSFKEQTLEASDHKSLRNLGLLQIMDMVYTKANGHRYSGRLNTDAFMSACRDSMYKLRMGPNTTWSGLNIFDDVANKLLWSSFNDVPTTWQEWVSPVSVNDFKTHNMYRMTHKGGYLKVGSDGELKHGAYTDDKYTVSADTFGKMVGLSRRDIINDDLGALSSIMSALGRESARFLEELFYCYFLNNLTTIFPTAGTYANYQSGSATDLGVDGLSTAEQMFRDQVDGDGAPMMVTPDMLLVGTQDAVIANELYNQVSLNVLQTANTKKRPDQNPHVGKYRPVVSGYLNNTAIIQRTDSLGTLGAAVPNQTTAQWFLLSSPNQSVGGLIMGAFLNGTKTPTVEQADQNFNVLGLQWRAYHDAGVGTGDPKLGIMSKGGA